MQPELIKAVQDNQICSVYVCRMTTSKTSTFDGIKPCYQQATWLKMRSDAKIASASKKITTSVHFRRRESVEEQRAQKYDRFLRGRQIAYMIYEYFRASGAYEAVQGLSDLFSIR